MIAASWPDEGSFQNVHFGWRSTSPIPLSVWSWPFVEKVSLMKSWVPTSMSRELVIPADTRVVPRPSARYWLGAEVSGCIPSEMASMRTRTPPGSIVWGTWVTCALREGANAASSRAAASAAGTRVGLGCIRVRLAADARAVTTIRAAPAPSVEDDGAVLAEEH